MMFLLLRRDKTLLSKMTKTVLSAPVGSSGQSVSISGQGNMGSHFWESSVPWNWIIGGVSLAAVGALAVGCAQKFKNSLFL